MADVSFELRMCLASIKRIDPYVVDIVATATHVVLYKFDMVNTEWQKSDIEGALFVYKRNGEPYHSIMVMNRSNTQNLIEPIVKNFNYQMQSPFLLYRNGDGKIFGIWFYNQDDCVTVTNHIKSVIDSFSANHNGSNSTAAREDVPTCDVFQLLSKAQEDFQKAPSTSSSPKPAAVECPSNNSVMDFFAKAGGGTTTSAKGKKEPIGMQKNDTAEHALKRLLAAPPPAPPAIQTVEQLEKQHRCFTPKKDGAIGSSATNPSPLLFNLLPQNLKAPLSPIASVTNNNNNINNNTNSSSNNNNNTNTNNSSVINGDWMTKLMTPGMFTAHDDNTLNDISTIIDKSGPSEQPTNEQVDLLTEKQLTQALIYLLRTNERFISDIHEAYVKSIMDKVNNFHL